MGKILISDETNNSYTAQVTNGRQVRAQTGGGSHYKIASAASSSSVALSSTGAWLDRVIIGSLPATATCLNFYDTSASALSAAESSGANHIAHLDIPVLAGVSAYNGPYSIDIGVYCTTGLTYALGDDGVSLGNHADITIIYQT